MAERWVVDSSPLISLGKIGHLGLLVSLASEVVVPEAVAAEVRRVSDEATAFLADASVAIRSVKPHPLVTPWGLGAGETAVLSLARDSGGVGVLDDRAARRCAATLGIPSRGTIGVVLLAKAHGLVPSARSLLDALRGAGLHVSPELLADALDLAGERGGES